LEKRGRGDERKVRESAGEKIKEYWGVDIPPVREND
jgi:hypothetical protein